MKKKLLVVLVLALFTGYTWAQKDINSEESLTVVYSDHVTYKGSAFDISSLLQSVTDKADDTALTDGVQFEAELLLPGGAPLPEGGAVDAGDYIIRLTAIADGGYTGTRELSVTIDPANLENVTFTTSAAKPFTGEAITLDASEVSGKLDTYDLQTADFTIDDSGYSNNTNAGEAEAKLTGAGNFTGTGTVEFTIDPVDITGATFTVSATKTYTGVEVKLDPADVSGTFGAAPYNLVNTDFTIEDSGYSNNTDAGEAEATLTGAGNFTGTTTVKFTIDPADIAGATFTVSATKTFTGEAITLQASELSGKLDTYTLVDTDFTIDDSSYSNNTNAGEATVTLTGAINFTGTTTVKFTIDPANIADAAFTVSATKTYTGEALTLDAADVSGTLDTYTLKSEDFTIKTDGYSNNINAGTATATLEGAINFTGTIPVNFTIAQADAAGIVVTGIDASYPYQAAAIEPVPVLTLDGKELVAGAGNDYEVTYGANTNAGTDAGTVDITLSANFIGTVTQQTFDIAAASLDTDVTIEVADQTYTGGTLQPAPVVSLGSVTLAEGTDYTVSYPDTDEGAYVEAGEWSVVITAAGTNLTGGPVTKTFTISAAQEPGEPEEPEESYNVTFVLPEEGVESNMDAAIYSVVDGDELDFYLEVTTLFRDGYVLKAYVDGEPHAIETLGDGVYKLVIDNIHSDLTVEVKLEKDSGSTGNINIAEESDLRIYAVDGVLVIENVSQPVSVMVYSVAGRLQANIVVKDIAQIPLSQGVYIVKAGNVSRKVVVAN